MLVIWRRWNNTKYPRLTGGGRSLSFWRYGKGRCHGGRCYWKDWYRRYFVDKRLPAKKLWRCCYHSFTGSLSWIVANADRAEGSNHPWRKAKTCPFMLLTHRRITILPIFNYFNKDQQVNVFKNRHPAVETLALRWKSASAGTFYGVFKEIFDQLTARRYRTITCWILRQRFTSSMTSPETTFAILNTTMHAE